MSDHLVPVKVYVYVFLTLMVMTVVTTAVAFVDLGRFNVVVALAIAVFKASLVVLFFMHVHYSTKLTKLIVASGIFWLAIMVFFTMTDLLTRGWLGVPGR
ncbi:MAG: cytochrome C oxidase subunit IV family protein [Acidobacteriota bacterium]|nr:cytochrome C oxidase subunit IV family protein [Acidobacteriota bacterium]